MVGVKGYGLHGGLSCGQTVAGDPVSRGKLIILCKQRQFLVTHRDANSLSSVYEGTPMLSSVYCEDEFNRGTGCGRWNLRRK